MGQNDRMIEGFKEGVRLLKEGDKATLFLPYNIAYGENGVQGIPPMSDLIFEVEINSLAVSYTHLTLPTILLV